MNKLTDLEACKRIAEIEGYNVGIWHDFVAITNPKDDSYLGEYNPLTDDALCFQLMVKYKVALDFTLCQSPFDYYCSWVGGFEIESQENYESPNKAICLAIIEAHKEL